jgi:hypothetical protein
MKIRQERFSRNVFSNGADCAAHRVSPQTNLTLSPVAFIQKGRESKNGAVMNRASWIASCF